MKSGILIVATNISIFRLSAKLELRRFPWKPQFIKIHKKSMVQFIKLFVGNVSKEKQQLQRLNKINVPSVCLIIIQLQLISLHIALLPNKFHIFVTE